ncbi:MAG TPA: VOC family protein [Mycobacteriales bacterium]|nr:VOC family protein [Mycobacteriales bacterium]
MVEFTSYPAGTPSWVDHATRDLAASNAFYGALFGWEAQDQGADMGNYTRLRKNGKNVAGNMPAMSAEQPSVWTTYICVDDADDTAARAKDAGATILAEPMDVSDLGRMAVFLDPTGAVIGIWQPKTFIGSELANEPGAFTWNELNTRDVDAATSFYSAVFGWSANSFEMGEMAYTEWKRADQSIAGMMAMPDMVPAQVPAHWLVYFAVEDADASVAKATGLGAATLVPPTDIPAGRFAVLSDPEGSVFGIIKTAAPTEA